MDVIYAGANCTLAAAGWRSNNTSSTSAIMGSSSGDTRFEHVLVLDVPFPDAHRALLEKHAKSIAYIQNASEADSVLDVCASLSSTCTHPADKMHI